MTHLLLYARIRNLLGAALVVAMALPAMANPPETNARGRAGQGIVGSGGSWLTGTSQDEQGRRFTCTLHLGEAIGPDRLDLDAGDGALTLSAHLQGRFQVVESSVLGATDPRSGL